MPNAGVRVAVCPRAPRAAPTRGQAGGDAPPQDASRDAQDTWRAPLDAAPLRTTATRPESLLVETRHGTPDAPAQRLARDTLLYDIHTLDNDTLFDVDTRVQLTRADMPSRLLPGELHNMWHIGAVDVAVAGMATHMLTVPVVAQTAWMLAALDLAAIGVVAIDAALRLEKAGDCYSAALHVNVCIYNTHIGVAHIPDVSDLLLRVVEHANGTTAPRSEPDAALVYKSLQRRAREELPCIDQPRQLAAHMLPFQRRAAAFLIEREMPPCERRVLRKKCGPWWTAIADTPLYLDVLRGIVTADARLAATDVCGAMLADEMGLGKTVEILALILERADLLRSDAEPVWDTEAQVHVQPVGATLIVAPETLRRQWLDEIGRHAPSLRVYSYTGHRAAAADATKAGMPSFVEWARALDVIVASFDTLGRELAASCKAPERALRRPAKYERPRSPLVQLEFLRVVMDEVQLVGGNASRTMAMVRRLASIAVSGTPVRRVSDLRTSLHFLGVQGACGSTKEWQRVLSTHLSPYLADVLATVGIRHTKSLVDHEMVLPPQTRMLVPIEFTSIETAFYRDVWNTALEALGMTADGAPASDTWQLDPPALRAQLLRLRQACTHPHVAARAAGGSTGSVTNLRSIDHVLAMMQEATRADLAAAMHTLAGRKIYCASVLLFAPAEELAALEAPRAGVEERAFYEQVSTRNHLDIARDTLETLLPYVNDKLRALSDEIDAAQTKGPLYVLSAEELAAAAAHESNADAAAPHEKLRLRQQHLGALRMRERHWLQILHRVQQFLGHCYFQLATREEQSGDPAVKPEPKAESQDAPPPPPDTKPHAHAAALHTLEDDAYAAAEKTRQRLLAEAGLVVARSARAVATQQQQHISLARELQPARTALPRTLFGRTVVDQVGALLRLLDAHARVILEWRGSLLARLLKPVNREVDKSRENDDIYAENLDAQIEAETILEMYRPLLAQRDEMLTGRIALGATARPQLYVELDRAHRNTRSRRFALDGPQDEPPQDDETAAVQRLQLAHFERLEAQRKTVAIEAESPSLAALQTALRELSESGTRADELAAIAQVQQRVRDELKTQTQLLEQVRREQGVFQTLFNARAVYFRQIQELSDQVQDPTWEGGVSASLYGALAQERSARLRIGALEGRLRYLAHLEEMQGDADAETRQCYICTEDIRTGILTNACGHLCCESCFSAWMSSGHRTCPLCKTRLSARDVHRVVYRASGAEAATPAVGVHAGAYRELGAEVRSTIEHVPIDGRYGSKLEMLTKHLVHLDRTTGEKSLVFSSFARGLDLVAESLRANGLSYARLESGAGKQVGAVAQLFKHSPTVNILLLHSEVQSAGLNLLDATHLFLLEPLLNHALELQAIGRVHRIGQTRRTNVYCYMVNDTVEQRIVALAASRGQSLYVGTDEDHDRAVPDSAALQAAALRHADGIEREARRGDLVASTDDLLACLFEQHIPGVPHAVQQRTAADPPTIDELRLRRIRAFDQ
ncbi:RING-type E3 ubiquitin transferase [Malassezia cuniculi]|uniref:RING-type E3 ubiquitin transferase n=1 Tax=Malassezia cuniculi TaxID=948313 RepID=A0AAF0EWE2_9BASI|nr:RING-type E3 ubiquitin transferase [Malassezia cuniculi]